MDSHHIVSANAAAQALGVQPGLKRATALAPDARRITKSEFDDLNLRQFGASMITSVGIGLFTFSALALIVDAAKRRKTDRRNFTLEPGPGPGQVGGSLRAHF